MDEQLLPGVWITHTRSWLPADEVLSHLADVDFEPTVDRAEPPPRRALPFPEWHRQAACVGAEEQTFFGARDTTERPAVSMSDVARAKAICITCPVFRTCLTEALGIGAGPREEYGIWAGTSGRTRKRIWEMVEREETTMAQVVDDICAGVGAQYERSVTLAPIAQVIPLKEAVA